MLARMKIVALAVCLVAAVLSAQSGEVLIVADEFPAMEVVAAKLKGDAQISSSLVRQSEMPAALANFECVIVYIHGALSERAENAFIDYAEAGGKLVLLHHSISSGKRKNARWFSFLGVDLPEGDVSRGGYKWIEGVTFSLVNLNPGHFIMTNHLSWPQHVAWATNTTVATTTLPGFTLTGTEVYLNHVHTEPRTLLMGLKFEDPASRKTYFQTTGGWVKRAGKGCIIYLMPGHTKHDFETTEYGQIVENAVTWKP